MSTTLAPTSDVVAVRDRADIARQVKLLTAYAVAAALLLLFALSIDDGNVAYTLGERVSKETPASEVDGLPLVWACFGVTVVALVLAALNRVPRKATGIVVHLLVGLDPALIYGLCSIDLADGPAYLSGVLPDAFWSVALYNEAGIVTYSTTNRDGIGQILELGIFNAAQTRLLAQQQLDVAEGLLVVESASDKLLALVRLIPPHPVMRERFAAELSEASCGTRSSSAATP